MDHRLDTALGELLGGLVVEAVNAAIEANNAASAGNIGGLGWPVLGIEEVDPQARVRLVGTVET